MRMLVIWCGLALLSSVATAQTNVTNTCPSDAPVSIQLTAAERGNGYVDATITNKSDRPVTAVILSVRVTDSTGAFYNETSSVDYAASGVLFDAGKATKTDIDLRVGNGRTLSAAEVGCLAVLYSGKGIWGDSKAPEVAHLRAVRQGIAAERRRLLDIYKREGIGKLEDELNRPVAR
jgi:hypothetical protein